LDWLFTTTSGDFLLERMDLETAIGDGLNASMISVFWCQGEREKSS
jgi:hypothetical protein